MPSNVYKDWNAVEFFQQLTAQNKLCQEKGFRFVKISGLQGLEEAISQMQETKNFVAVIDNAVGYTELQNTPHTTRVRTLFFAMRHKLGDMSARERCMDTIRDIHQQFCSKLLMERTRLEQDRLYIDSRITLQEASQYLVPGTAICMCEISVTKYIDLSFNPDQWL